MRFKVHCACDGTTMYHDSKNNKEYFDQFEICDLLNRLSKAEDLIEDRLRHLENEYNRGVRFGLPTGGVIAEINLLEEIKEELDSN